MSYLKVEVFCCKYCGEVKGMYSGKKTADPRWKFLSCICKKGGPDAVKDN